MANLEPPSEHPLLQNIAGVTSASHCSPFVVGQLFASRKSFRLFLFSCRINTIAYWLTFICHDQPMIPTFVFGWPSGKETGDFLALDLGTSHLLSHLVF